MAENVRTGISESPSPSPPSAMALVPPSLIGL